MADENNQSIYALLKAKALRLDNKPDEALAVLEPFSQRSIAEINLELSEIALTLKNTALATIAVGAAPLIGKAKVLSVTDENDGFEKLALITTMSESLTSCGRTLQDCCRSVSPTASTSCSATRDGENFRPHVYIQW